MLTTWPQENLLSSLVPLFSVVPLKVRSLLEDDAAPARRLHRVI